MLAWILTVKEKASDDSLPTRSKKGWVSMDMVLRVYIKAGREASEGYGLFSYARTSKVGMTTNGIFGCSPYVGKNRSVFISFQQPCYHATSEIVTDGSKAKRIDSWSWRAPARGSEWSRMM
jgi:hypothetical protein